jgi:hypothetical protein
MMIQQRGGHGVIDDNNNLESDAFDLDASEKAHLPCHRTHFNLKGGTGREEGHQPPSKESVPNLNLNSLESKRSNQIII